MSTDHADIFTNIGLAEKTVAETLQNKKLSTVLYECIQEAGLLNGCEKSKGTLIYDVATKLPATAPREYRSLLLKYVADGRIANSTQLNAALEFIKKQKSAEISHQKFEEAAGVGIVVTPEDIVAGVKECLAANEAEIREKRWATRGNLMKKLTDSRLMWGNRGQLMQELDAQLTAMIGEKTDADRQKPVSKKAPAKTAASATKTATEDAASIALRDKWPAPHQNPFNSPEVLKAHLERTGGKVVTRFPPEPNGWPHIGHAKAMWIDFGQAQVHGGVCYLRYDDTNPAAEKQEYIDAIRENVEWLGYEPYKITFASDHFETLYNLAVKLIKKGKAYVSHSTSEEIAKGREEKTNDKWRDRAMEENLHEFDKMRRGYYAEGEAVLRMKMDMQSDNPCMRDLIAYRVIHKPHPRTGDTWCIYPSYDFTHCICDSLEDITHSLCTLEFYIRRESYYWVLDQLDMYKPIVWEYSRLNMTHTVVSKRLLRALVEKGIARGWDDPRMPTLMGLRRRGFTAAAVKNLCEKVGVTRSDNTLTSFELLEHCVRVDLDEKARRTFIVLSPLKVTLTNYPESQVETVDAPLLPRDKSLGTYKMPLSRVIYIDRSDFSNEKRGDDYYGLELGKTVGLKYAGHITCTKVIEKDGEVVELEATYHTSAETKVKGHIHWVAEPEPGKKPVVAEVRIYDHLFTPEDMNKEEYAKNYMAAYNPNSEVIVPEAFVEPSIADCPPYTAFQAERVGYFCVDVESKPGRLILNRTVSLKESYPRATPGAAASAKKSKK